MPERREHAGFARCEQSPSKENGFAAADVGTRECHVRARPCRPSHDQYASSRTSVNSIITTARRRAAAPRRWRWTRPIPVRQQRPAECPRRWWWNQSPTSPGDLPTAPNVSSARTAKPSTLERSNPGTSTGANIGGEQRARGKRRATRFPKREGSDRGGRGSGEGPHLGRVRSGTGVGGGRRSCPRVRAVEMGQAASKRCRSRRLFTSRASRIS